jgi:ADP-ribose pyrophosphatase YjhB (NUDIX family)
MARPPQFKFCPYCAAGLVSRPVLDRERPVCEACGYIQFLSPVAGVAAVIRDDDGRVLLARKASTGEWHFPSGYVEWHEDVRESVTRELEEELGLKAEVGRILAVHTNIDSPDRCTVGIWFSARVTGGRLELKQPDEVDAADYFAPADAPTLAYANDRRVLDALDG